MSERYCIWDRGFRLAIIFISKWLKANYTSAATAVNVLYCCKEQLAVFRLCGNLLYTAYEDCVIKLYRKDTVRGAKNMANYWVEHIKIPSTDLTKQGLEIDADTIPTSICATKNFMAAIFFNEQTKKSNLVLAQKALSKLKVTSIRATVGKQSACFHLTPICCNNREILLVPFSKGSLAIVIIREANISKVYYTFSECTSRINGIIITAPGIAVIYGESPVTSIKFKVN